MGSLHPLVAFRFQVKQTYCRTGTGTQKQQGAHSAGGIGPPRAGAPKDVAPGHQQHATGHQGTGDHDGDGNFNQRSGRYT